VSAGWSSLLARPGFAPWAVANGALSVSWTVSSVAFSWVTLIVTTDPFAVGAVFATRFIALLLFGIPAGVIADRRERRRIVIGTSIGGAIAATTLAGIALTSGEAPGLPILLAGSFILGLLDTQRIAAGTAYTVDLAGPALATSGLAIVNLVAQLAGIGGSAAGGVILRDLGLAASFLVTAGALLLVAAILAFAPRPGAEHGRSGGVGRGTPVSLRSAFTLIRRDRLIALLAVSVILGEILAFSSITLVPVFTRDLWDAGSDAYGFLVAVRAAGAVAGLVLLIRFGARLTTGPILGALGVVMGVALIGFAVSPTLLVALIPTLLIGASFATWDSLSQALMQRATTDAERGAAMGIWTFAVGGGPAGYLAIGALAGAFGPVATQVLFGALTVATGVWMLLVPRIRAAR